MIDLLKKAWAACSWEARVIVVAIAGLTGVAAVATLVARHLA